MKNLICLLLLLLALPSHAANKYVRAGAGGSTGNDWSSAYSSLPATLDRSFTYYVAAGTYPGYTANTPNSGSTWLFIKKATVADHGTSAGWQDSYGTGQAVWTGPILPYTDYWEWDGQTRNENDWADAASYGFAVYTPFLNQIISNYGQSPAGDGDHWSIKYFSLGRTSYAGGWPARGDDQNTVYMHGHVYDGWNISRCLHRFVPGPYMGEVHGFTNEYCHFTIHTGKTAMRGNGGSVDWYIRFNHFVDCGVSYLDTQGEKATQTTIITGWGYTGMARWYIYGNWAHETGTGGDIHYSNAGLCQLGGLGHGVNAPANLQINGCRVFNNVFSQLGRAISGSPVGIECNGTDNEVHNNVWLLPGNGTYAYINATKASNNWILGSSAAAVQSQWPTTLIGTMDPFVNSVGMNFLPRDPAQVSNPDIINAGVRVPAPFNVDPLGNSRDGDSATDIGVFENNGQPGVSDTTPPNAPTGVDGTAVSQTQIDLMWQAATDLGGGVVVRYRVLRNDSEVASVTTLTYSDPGLTPSTTYTYKVIAVDSSNNHSVPSASANVTTLSPDVVAPAAPTSVAIVALSSSSVLFSWTNATDNIGVVSYNVYRNGSLAGNTINTNFLDNGLAAETLFSYTVKSVDGGGNLSTATTATNVTTLQAPAFPTNQLQLWLRADVGVSRVDNTDRVVFWNDQSGNARNATQATIESQPLLFTNSVGGKPALLFDGVADHLTFSLPVNGQTQMTIYMVSRNNANQVTGASEAENAALFWNESAAWGTVYLAPFQAKMHFRFGTTQSGNRFTYTRPALETNFTISTIMHSNDWDRAWVDGLLVVSQSGRLSPIAACVATGNIGRGYNDNTYFAGEIAELFVYFTAHTTTERDQVRNYLQAKYFSSDVTPPSVPASLNATAISPTRIDLTWSASTGEPHHYEILRDAAVIATTTATTYSDTGVVANHANYVYTIKSVDAAGNKSTESASDTESTPDNPAPTTNPMRKLRTGQSLGPMLSQ